MTLEEAPPGAICPGFSTKSLLSGKPLSAGQIGCSLFYFHPNWVSCNTILMLTTQSEHQIPQVKGSLFHKTAPTSDTTYKWDPQATWISKQLATNPEGSHSPP